LSLGPSPSALNALHSAMIALPSAMIALPFLGGPRR
jgi:hypothetical protein